MDCHKYKHIIAEAALGGKVGLSRDALDDLRAHLADCRACRQEFRRTRAFYERMRSGGPIEIPADMLEAAHDRIMRSVRKKRGLRRFGGAGFFFTGAAAAAAIILIAVAIHRIVSPGTVPVPQPLAVESPSASVQHAQPESPSISKPTITQAPEASRNVLGAQFGKEIGSPQEALSFTQTAFDEATGKQTGGDFQALIELCDTLITRWPDSPESLEARKLISRCYTQMAEHEAARVAFLAYADEAGQRAKLAALTQNADPDQAAAQAASTTAGIIVQETNVLFVKRYYITALSYGDVVLTRYPGTEPARCVRNLAAEYCHKTGQARQAVEEFRAVVAEAPESRSASVARAHLPEALMDSGQPNAGIQAWLDYSAAASDENEKACGYYCAGDILALRGEQHYPEAMRLLEKVVKEHPESRYAMSAQHRLSMIHRELTKRFGDVNDLLDIEDVLKMEDRFYLEEIPGLKDILKDREMIDVLRM